MREFNIQGGQVVDLTQPKFAIAYRAQPYAPGLSEVNGCDVRAWPHYHFTRNLQHCRFVPCDTNVSTAYFGFNPLAVFVETDVTFRQSSIDLPRPLFYGEQELQQKEIIAFSLPHSLRLFDLCSQFAFVRHGLKPDDPVLTSTHYLASHLFAEQVYQAGFDGILYRTRQGIDNAVVIFERAKAAICSTEILSRKSALTVLREYPNAEKLLGIKIVEDC